MKKIVFTIALLAILGAVSYASTSTSGNPNNKHQSGAASAKTHKNIHHTHIVVPSDHYNM